MMWKENVHAKKGFFIDCHENLLSVKLRCLCTSDDEQIKLLVKNVLGDYQIAIE